MKKRPTADLVPQGDLPVVFYGALVGFVEVAVVCLAVYGLVRATKPPVDNSKRQYLAGSIPYLYCHQA